MNERTCQQCGEAFYAARGTKRCPDCIGETPVRDCVTEMQSNRNARLARGLRMLRGSED